MHDYLKGAIARRWKLLVAQGLILILLGALAVAAPSIATLTVELFIGWLFVISGVTGVIAVLSSRDIPAFLWVLVTAALSLILGILLVWHPTAGAISLTFLLVAFFFTEGIFQTASSIAYRDVLGGSWGFVLLSGITDLALAAIIFVALPQSAGWAIGLLVGINLLTSGFAVLTIAFTGRRLAKELGVA